MQVRKIPSAQHLVRFLDSDPHKIAKAIVRSAESPPHFSYAPLVTMITSAIRLGESIDSLKLSIAKSVKNERTRHIYLDVLPCLFGYLTNRARTYIQPFGERLAFNAGRGLVVPVTPMCLIGTGHSLVIPHISLWRVDVMTKPRLSLFSTIFADVLNQEPDFAEAELEFVSLSAAGPEAPRMVNVTPFRDIPLLCKSELVELLELLHAGLDLAEKQLAANASSSNASALRKEIRGDDSDERQGKLL